MMRKTVVAGLLCLLAGSSAEAKDSFWGSFYRTMNDIDRNLCATFQSSKCKKPARQPSRTRVARPAPQPDLPASPEVQQPVPEEPAQQTVIMQTPKPQPKSVASNPSGAACLQNLSSAGAKFVAASVSADQPGCSVDSPVRLMAVEFAGGKVSLPDLPILSCPFALQFSQWVAQGAEGIVEAKSSSRLKWISTGPGFECRTRNNDNSAKLSEHAKGNAVDISQFMLANGTGWKVRELTNPNGSDFDVLKTLRISACEDFTTVLGPGSDAAHAEHFHLDLAARKNGYRICQ